MLDQSHIGKTAAFAFKPSQRRQQESAMASAAPFDAVDHVVDLDGFQPIHCSLSGRASCPLAIVLGGISADRRIHRWWPEVAGARGVLNGNRFRRLSIDWPTAEDGKQIGVDDFADALADILDSLGFARVHAVVGASFGAMVGLAFAARHAGRVGRLIAISGAHRSTPAATAGRLIQRHIIESLAQSGFPDRGVALARSLALTSYRPAALFDQRFYNSDPRQTLYDIDRYLEYNGSSFAERFDAKNYLALSSALDHHHVDPALVRCRTELVAVTSDQLVPVSQLRELAGAIGIHARLHLVDSPYGHDAFLKSARILNPLLARLLADQEGAQDHD